MSTTEPAPARTAPLALWRVAETLLRTLHMLFGAPEDVAAQHTFTAKAHATLASWLRCAEAMLRRLLLIEAAALPKPGAHTPPRPARPRERKLMSFEADQPETWRVSFRCFTSSPARGGRISAQSAMTMGAGDRCASPAGAGGRRFCSAWPLAERYEALLRVFNDPTAYARRLARRLHAAPQLLAQALRAPPEAAHRVDLFDESGERAESAWALHFSSA
ncbi:MAG: hypothetical protein H7124_11035 [Phycisphaerales bacterium]|nr:hypothetical protein [Hyphomonadaceae bacterium]